MSQYEAKYTYIDVIASVFTSLHPYLVDEACRRGLPVDKVISEMVNEALARRRSSCARKKSTKPSESLVPGIAK